MTHIPCSTVAKQLPLLVHGDLSEGEKQLILNHLSGCPPCQSAYERLHKTFEVLQTWKTEPEDFGAFNQALFQRLRENRPGQASVLRPRWVLRPVIVAPIVSVCFLLLAVGLWHRPHGTSLQELSILESVGEEVPEVEKELLEGDILSQDEMLLAEATTPIQETELLQELEVLEQLGEGEEIRDSPGTELEEDVLTTDEEALG